MNNTLFYELFDEEEFESFIKNVIKLFRLSTEYNMWLNQCNRSTCAATGLNKYESGADVEVHHYGKTLWDWVEIIVDKFVENNVRFNTFYVLMILSDIHLQNCVPYVPLTHCIHKMLHTDYSNTIKLFPGIEDNAYEGDIQKAHMIIDKYINLYKKFIISEEDLVNERKSES